VTGAVVIVVSFAMDYRMLMAGGMPQGFHWSVFLAGLALGTGSYVWAARSTAPDRHLREYQRSS